MILVCSSRRPNVHVRASWAVFAGIKSRAIPVNAEPEALETVLRLEPWKSAFQTRPVPFEEFREGPVQALQRVNQRLPREPIKLWVLVPDLRQARRLVAQGDGDTIFPVCLNALLKGGIIQCPVKLRVPLQLR